MFSHVRTGTRVKCCAPIGLVRFLGALLQQSSGVENSTTVDMWTEHLQRPVTHNGDIDPACYLYDPGLQDCVSPVLLLR